MPLTRLESVIRLLRALPEDQQETWAQHIELALRQDRESLLTDAQWSEIDRRMADNDAEVVLHEDVANRMRAKYGS